MTNFGMLFNRALCFGCNACVVSCQIEYNTSVPNKFNSVDLSINGNYPNTALTFTPKLCNQCDDAPCIPSCPVTAISKRVDGIVAIDRAKCVGCAICVTKCPYKAVHIDNAGRASKCEFCFDRRALNESAPYCVKDCPTKARKLVNLVSQDLTGYTRAEGLGGAKPNVWYTDDIQR